MTPEERAEKLYMSIVMETGRGSSAVRIALIVQAIREAEAEATAREREACASLVEKTTMAGAEGLSVFLAAAIRARGKP